MKNRIPYVDLAKGICISIVMLFHIKNINPNTFLLSPILFSACMLPPFYFLSGYFFKEERSLRLFLYKKVNRLVVPFVFFYLTTSVLVPNLLHSMVGIQFETVTGWPSLWAFIYPGEYPNFPIWFLWCLFVMNCLFYAILSLAKLLSGRNREGAIVFLCIGCAFLGVCAEKHFGTDIANLFEALKNMPFLGLGFLSSQKNTLSILTTASPTKKVVLAIASFCFTLLSCWPADAYHVWQVILMYYIPGIAGSFLILSVSALLVRLPLISYIGKYSIILVLTHGLMVRMGYHFFLNISEFVGPYISITLFWTIMALSYLVIIPFTLRYLPHVSGQVPLFGKRPAH